MNNDDYLPRVLEDNPQLDMPVPSDASKWLAVHDVLENTASDNVGSRGGTGSLFTVAWVLGLTLGLLWVWRNGSTVFQQWQENVHRRANRRRHGIPDDDDRPFNVAYSAAALARKQREDKQHPTVAAKLQRHSPQRGAGLQKTGESVRLRQVHTDSVSAISGHNMQAMFVQGNSTNPSSISDNEFVAQSSAHSARQPPAVREQSFSDPYNPNLDRVLNQNNAQPAAQELQFSSSDDNATHGRKASNDTEGLHSLPGRRKHHHVDNDDDEDRTSKRTRVDREEFIDGDNDAPWMPGGSRRPSLQVPKRGAKRHANHEDEGDWEMSQDKRARKGSLAIPGSDADDDDVDMAHESSDAEPQPSRGTKRDRDDPDSGGDDLSGNLGELHRSRKRRVNGRGRMDEVLLGNRKRDRSPEGPESSDNEGGKSDGQTVRHKRGRRHKVQEEEVIMGTADASESDDIPDFSEDPACVGRRIGEIWEVNGQSFKVGLDGRRLRHALIKQKRNKFPMPKDSAHNDARTNVDVVVEKWLNDEEYKAAKEKFELAWQDPSPASTPIKAETTMEDEHPSSAGKRLLWGGPRPSLVTSRASIGSSSIQNPFDLAPSDVGRRVASSQFLMNNPGESPKLRSSKSFSKWEKQDMEANSLKKMRARLEKEREKEKKEKDLQEKAKSLLAPAAASIPFAPTTNKPTQEAKSNYTPATATDNQGTKTTTTAFPPLLAKPASNTVAALSFAKPSSNTSSEPSPFAKPASDTPARPSPFTKLASDTSAAPSSFAKPASDTNTGAMPNFFAKPATTPAAGVTGSMTQPSTTSMFPSSTQTATSSQTTKEPTAAKPTLTFGPLSASSSTPESNKGGMSKPLFSFAPTSTSPSSAPATTGDSKPIFSFSTPPAQGNKSELSKANTSNFANPQIVAAMPSEQVNVVTPSAFPKPTSQLASAPFAPTDNSPFSFNQSSQISQTANQTPPAFQFNVPNTPQNNMSGAPSGAGLGSGSGSLLDRLGPAPASSEPSKHTATPQNAWSSPFGGPGSSVSSANIPSTSIFGQPQLQSQQGTSNVSESTNKPSMFTPSGPIKTVFGQPSTTPTATPTATPPPISFANAPNTNSVSKTGAPSVFGKLNVQSDASSSQLAAPSIFGKPNYQSGASPAAPIFGQPSGLSGASGSQQAAFAMFGKPSGQPDESSSQPVGQSIFGKPSSSQSNPSPAGPIFGKPSGPSGASGSQQTPFSMFGKPSAADASLSQSAGQSIFGKPSSQSDASASQPAVPSIFGNLSGQSDASKSSASSIFGNPGGQPEASVSQPKPGFAFGFGNTTSTSTPNANPFNLPQAPSTSTQAAPIAPNTLFGFGQSSSTTTPSGTSAFGFSNKPTEGDKK